MVFFYFRAIFLFLQRQQTLSLANFYKVFKAGSGSALRKQLDPDPHWESSWIRIRIENNAGSESEKNECGSTAPGFHLGKPADQRIHKALEVVPGHMAET